MRDWEKGGAGDEGGEGVNPPPGVRGGWGGVAEVGGGVPGSPGAADEERLDALLHRGLEGEGEEMAAIPGAGQASPVATGVAGDPRGVAAEGEGGPGGRPGG